MATCICMGNIDSVSWCSFDWVYRLADQENYWCKIKKQLSRLDIRRLMDIRLGMCDPACIKYIQEILRYLEETAPITVTITQPLNKITVMVSEPELEFTDRSWWVDSDSEGWNLK